MPTNPDRQIWRFSYTPWPAPLGPCGEIRRTSTDATTHKTGGTHVFLYVLAFALRTRHSLFVPCKDNPLKLFAAALAGIFKDRHGSRFLIFQHHSDKSGGEKLKVIAYRKQDNILLCLLFRPGSNGNSLMYYQPSLPRWVNHKI